MVGKPRIPKVKRNCLYCQTEFEVPETSTKKLCSVPCSNKWIAGRREGYHEKGQYISVCQNCKKEIVHKYKCHAISCKFCSKHCSSEFKKFGEVKNQYGFTKKWTDEDDKILIEEYPTCIHPKLLAKKLGRNIEALHKRANWLGLKRTPEAISEGIKDGGRKNKGRKRPDFIKNVFHCGSGSDNNFYGKKHKKENLKKLSEIAKKLGTFNRLNKDPEFQKKRQEALHKARRNKGPNKAELKLDTLIQKMFPGEYCFTGNGSFIIDGLNPDWTNINGQKKLIELFGEHVHHTKKAFIKVPKRSTYRGRKKAFAKFGYKTLIIWWSELKDMDFVASKLEAFHCE